MTVQWQPYLWKQPRPASAQEIEQLEQQWGVTLPEAYKQTVSLHQGMTPEPYVFLVGQVRDAFNTLLTVSTFPDTVPYSIARVHSILEPLLPTGIFPFANTPGGEYLCFDYRGSPSEPAVVLVTVEGSIEPVAGSFSEFMSGLQPA